MNDIKDFQKQAEKMAFESKCRQQALMYIRRAQSSGMPYLRINKDEFSKLLSTEYHLNSYKDEDSIEDNLKINEFSDKIFDNIQEIISNNKFILIDGGSELNRKKAGCALLFKIILADKYGLYVSCTSLQEQLKTINSNRIEIIKECKKYDALFISEFSMSLFKIITNDAGDLFDEILSYRYDYNKITIVSFTDAISGYSLEADKRCGRYLYDLSHKNYNENKKNNPCNGILRIRVKGS